MDILAVDVVLLPPPDITDRIVSLTKHLPAAANRLNTTVCLPHISLNMGLLKSSDLAKVKGLLSPFAEQAKELFITLTKVESFTVSGNKQFSELRVDLTPQLKQLHTGIIKTFETILTREGVKIDMFASPPSVAADSTYWVTHYLENSSFDRFNPHITLGEGTIDDITEPIKFSGCQLVLCHLGTYCTCRKILVVG